MVIARHSYIPVNDVVYSATCGKALASNEKRMQPVLTAIIYVTKRVIISHNSRLSHGHMYAQEVTCKVAFNSPAKPELYSQSSKQKSKE
jgi:hypothetical protein